MILGIGFGFLGKANPMLWPLGIFLGEVLFGVGSLLKNLFFYSGGVNLFLPLGLLFLIPFTAPALVGSFIGFGLRKALYKARNSDAGCRACCRMTDRMGQPDRTRVQMEPHREHQVSDPGAKRPIVISAVRARQGVTGHNVRYVLGFGLAGAIIALTVLYLSYFAVD